uniref:Biotin carboxylation domain-containing protein n=1 Tax=Globodera pallida TaxID=36090 RepID=A0A183CSJ5_GLOPA
VEHPITEAITGLDLVQWQFRVAQGDCLPLRQEQIALNGHAVEARIYAEDSEAGFMPAPGQLEHLSFPLAMPNLRVDSAVREGDAVTVHYDPMVAKVIAWGTDRSEAIRRLDEGLRQTHIGGLCNNVRFVRACLGHERFRLGDVYTDFVAEHLDQLLSQCKSPVAREGKSELLVEAVLAQLLLHRV